MKKTTTYQYTGKPQGQGKQGPRGQVMCVAFEGEWV